MNYVVKNTQLGPHIFFAGSMDLNFWPGVVITTMVFDAWRFTDKAEAETLLKDLPGEWFISEVSEVQTSNNLKGKESL